jgi:hypothetical protein
MHFKLIMITVSISSIFLAFSPPQKSTKVPVNSVTVPSKAFGTFEGTQEAYVFYAGGLGISAPASEWKLTIKKNKIELIQYCNGETYLYTGYYIIKKHSNDSTGVLKCKLKILKDGSVDQFEPTLEYCCNEQGEYYWTKLPDTEGEPSVVFARAE